MIVDDLTAEDIAARFAALEAGVALTEHQTAQPTTIPVTYEEEEAWVEVERKVNRFVRPLSVAAEEWFEVTQNTEGRWHLGLKEVDVMTRGFGKGELVMLTGFSHSGKTQVALTSILHNLQRRSVIVTMDEPEILVLAKLVGMRLRMDGAELERRIKDNDPATIKTVRETAQHSFKNVLVVEGAYTLDDFSAVRKEAAAYFGQEVDMMCIDYLELLRGNDVSDVEAKAQSLKPWAKQQPFPVICIHQGSRGNAGKGQKLTMQSMKYGGEAEANFVIGVRRPSDDPDSGLGPDDPQVLVSVIKNKRPPGRKGEHLYLMDIKCGLIEPFRSEQPQFRSVLAND